MRTIIEFDEIDGERWDSVGGAFSLNESIATFEGEMPAGGAATVPRVRLALEPSDLSRFEGLAIRAEGQGGPFELWLGTEGDAGHGGYRARFNAPDGDLGQVRIPFASVEATDAPPLDPARIVEIGFAVSPEHAGPFRLSVEWVRAYGVPGRPTR